MDLIDRQGAIKHLTKARMINDSRCMEDIFADIPSQNKWIPVKERLPEQDVEVLCSCWDGGITVAKRNQFGGWYDREENIYYPNYSILAWLPLPQSYEAERSE